MKVTRCWLHTSVIPDWVYLDYFNPISLQASSLWYGRAESAGGSRDRNFFSQSLERRLRQEEFRPVSCLFVSSWLIALWVFLALDSFLPPHPPSLFTGDYHILWDSGEIINVRHERRAHQCWAELLSLSGNSTLCLQQLDLCLCRLALALMKWVCCRFVLSACVNCVPIKSQAKTLCLCRAGSGCSFGNTCHCHCLLPYNSEELVSNGWS